MRKNLGLFLLTCFQASAALILTISDPSQTVAPGAHGVYHGTLLNTDAVGNTVQSFVVIAAPTDATSPPTAGQLFPEAEPAVPFNIAAGGQFTGVILDITVPTAAQTRDHPFGVQAFTSGHDANGNSIGSNSVSADLNVTTPEPGYGILVCIGFAGLLMAKRISSKSLRSSGSRER